jgi:hypothetical protein
MDMLTARMTQATPQATAIASNLVRFMKRPPREGSRRAKGIAQRQEGEVLSTLMGSWKFPHGIFGR